MESTIAVIILFLCMTSFSETSAKTNTAGFTENNHLNGDFSELSSEELSIEIDNCHEACLQKDSGITVKSYPLTVDTSQAIKMKPENEDNANELSTNAEQSIDKYEYAENYRRRLISASDAENQFKSLMLGVVAALIVFLFILTVFCASRRNDAKTIDTHPIYSQQSNELLNEVVINSS